MTKNGDSSEKPSPEAKEAPSAPRSVRDTLGGGRKRGRGRPSRSGGSGSGGRGKGPRRPTPVSNTGGSTDKSADPPQATRIRTRSRTVTYKGEAWNVEVDGSSYIGGGGHSQARLLSLVFRSTEEVPNIRGPVYAVAEDLDELPDEELGRLLEESPDPRQRVTEAVKKAAGGRPGRPRRSRG